MMPRQLTAAVRCYLGMRRVVIATIGEPAGIDISLSQSTKWPAAQVWCQIWWLFFYSGMRREFADPRAQAAIKGGWFNDFLVFATANAEPGHTWHVKPLGRSFKTIGKDAQSFCARTGAYATMPYRTGARVVHRINRLAEFFSNLDTAARHAGRSIVDELAGGNARGDNALDIAFAKLGAVTGPITALHILSDLGFACHKPDVWMCRIASWCGWTPGYSPDDLMKNRRGGWSVLRAACQDIAAAAVATGTVSDANPLRALDWYVANYGMLKRPTRCHCDENDALVEA
jgi:hypothetical protein